MESIKSHLKASLLWFGAALVSVSMYLPSLTHARTSSYGVLPPGAKIVAGDPDKNEFYILAKGEAPPLVNVNDLPKREKHPIAVIQLAQHKPAIKILKKQQKLSLKRTKHPFDNVIQALSNKKVIAKLNNALHGKDYKKLNMQFREFFGKKEVKRLQEAINRELKSKKKDLVKVT